jgi:hypothetical protein
MRDRIQITSSNQLIDYGFVWRLNCIVNKHCVCMKHVCRVYLHIYIKHEVNF